MMKTLIEKQHQFFATQQTKDLSFRKKLLKKLQEVIIAQEDAICDAVYADFKKPRPETILSETQFVLAELKHVIRNMDSWARPEKVASSLANWPSSDYIHSEPYGAVLIMSPSNYPFQLAMVPLIGAIAAGNTAVVKPSEKTPHTAAILSRIISAVFMPEHVAVVEGNFEVSQSLLAEKWDYIFFTGSTPVGKIVYEHAAKHLTPVTLELGGKNPCIVDPSASLSLAAKRIVWGKFLNAGQTCIAPDYILVHGSVKEQLVEGLIKYITKSYGATMEKSPDFARIIDKAHYDRLKKMLEGEHLLYGGYFNDGDRYLSPTLVNEPKRDSKIMQGEIFGPILPIISYENEVDIQKYIHQYGKPLATYVFSNRKKFQQRIIGTYSFGGGAINDTIVQITNKRLPFGGVGTSGIGSYHGKTSFTVFSHRKPIVKRANWLDPTIRYPPYNLPMSLIKWVKNLL